VMELSFVTSIVAPGSAVRAAKTSLTVCKSCVSMSSQHQHVLQDLTLNLGFIAGSYTTADLSCDKIVAVNGHLVPVTELDMLDLGIQGSTLVKV
jgi:hypothetical protein